MLHFNITSGVILMQQSNNLSIQIWLKDLYQRLAEQELLHDMPKANKAPSPEEMISELLNELHILDDKMMRMHDSLLADHQMMPINQRQARLSALKEVAKAIESTEDKIKTLEASCV